MKPALLLAITKHEMDPGQLFKVDPQLKDRPKDAHLQLSDMGIIIKAKRDASVRNGFPTQLKSKEVEVEQEITGKETVKEKLSSRAVMKKQGLGDVCLHKRRTTQIET